MGSQSWLASTSWKVTLLLTSWSSAVSILVISLSSPETAADMSFRWEVGVKNSGHHHSCHAQTHNSSVCVCVSSSSSVLQGEKIFYLIKPTLANLALYEAWSSSPNQSEVFFGDKVEKCYKCVVSQGTTMLIPTGLVIIFYACMECLKCFYYVIS